MLSKIWRLCSDMKFKAIMKECWPKNRMLCADLIEVCWSDRTGQPRSTMANLEEVSARGAHLVMDEAVPPNLDIVLRMKQGDISATVQDCHHEVDFGFALSVLLTKKSRWKTHPRHLFDPRGLRRRGTAESHMPS